MSTIEVQKWPTIEIQKWFIIQVQKWPKIEIQNGSQKFLNHVYDSF